MIYLYYLIATFGLWVGVGLLALIELKGKSRELKIISLSIVTVVIWGFFGPQLHSRLKAERIKGKTSVTARLDYKRRLYPDGEQIMLPVINENHGSLGAVECVMSCKASLKGKIIYRSPVVSGPMKGKYLAPKERLMDLYYPVPSNVFYRLVAASPDGELNFLEWWIEYYATDGEESKWGCYRERFLPRNENGKITYLMIEQSNVCEEVEKKRTWWGRLWLKKDYSDIEGQSVSSNSDMKVEENIESR